MTKKQLSIAKRLFRKWIIEEQDATYFGDVRDAINDMKELFRILKISNAAKEIENESYGGTI